MTTTRDLPSGDHGQLPPVKDARVYDWAGVRYKCRARWKQPLQNAPKWCERGIQAYEKFLDVFFLDRIERTSSGVDAADVAATVRSTQSCTSTAVVVSHCRLHNNAMQTKFKGFQLRARDGLLSEADWHYISNEMDRSKKAVDFAGPGVYKLVTRRRDRDQLNLEALESAIANGMPAIRLRAVNSSAVATAAHDCEIGLPSDLYLSIGARVMITHNLCVKLGLCNGTVVSCSTRVDTTTTSTLSEPSRAEPRGRVRI